jgi:hypothetical protein
LRREKERGMMHTHPPKNDRFEWSQFGARGAGPGTRGIVPALPDPAPVAALREGRQQKEKTMVKHDDDERGREGLDGLAGTPLGKLLGIGNGGKGRGDDGQKGGGETVMLERLARSLEKAGAVELARLIRGGRK